MSKPKRLLALVLCAILLISIVPVQALADTTSTDGVVKVEHNGEITYYETLQTAFDGFAPSNNPMAAHR